MSFAAEFGTGQVLWSILWFALFVLWIYLLITVFADIMRARDLSGWGKALWAVAIIAWDLCYYWSHRVQHEVSVFWAGHAVHHQSEDYNLSTALRQPSTGFLLTWIFYLPLFVLGFPVEVLITITRLPIRAPIL